MKIFRYVKNPKQELDYSEKKRCDLCQENKPGYGGSYGFHPDSDEGIYFICEDCLSDGKLRKFGQSNNGSFKTLTLQLSALNPNLQEDKIARIVADKTDEIEYRTPSYSSWQEHDWPVHHGDYCILIGEAGKKELNSLAQDGNGRKFLDSVLYWTEESNSGDGYKQEEQWDEKYRDWLWNYIPDQAPRESSDPTSPLILFQCMTQKEYVAILDFE